MVYTGPQRYPGASTAYWYQDTYGGDRMESNVIVWHSTEGTSLPSYGGGAMAPNFTAKPDFANKRLVWYQHFDFDRSSRALVNAAGGVETNTLNVCQVEVVSTCDPATHKKWTDAGIPHLYTADLPGWVIRDLAAFAKWAHDNHDVPLTSSLAFKAYPGSYGASNGVRMSGSQWNGFRGHCGHQHVPENLHGDPGAFPMAAILTAAKGTTAPEEHEMQLSDQIRLRDWVAAYWPNDKGLQDGQIPVDVALGSGYAHSRKAAENTDRILAELAAVRASEAAQTAAITAMAEALARVDGAVDVPGLVAQVRQAVTDAATAALESVTVHLDVTPGQG